jgi:hypothetical protein
MRADRTAQRIPISAPTIAGIYLLIQCLHWCDTPDFLVLAYMIVRPPSITRHAPVINAPLWLRQVQEHGRVAGSSEGQMSRVVSVG